VFLCGVGRHLRDLITMLDDLRARGVKFQSLTEAIDTATTTGRAMWQMIGVLAELEQSLYQSALIRSKGSAAPGCEIWPEGETNALPNRSRTEGNRKRRRPSVRRQPAKCRPLDAVPGACLMRLPGLFYGPEQMFIGQKPREDFQIRCWKRRFF